MNKTIYIIRHGESEGNRLDTTQNVKTPLSENGIEQAKVVKGKIQNLNIDEYITSDMQRAKHTGEIIFFDKLNGKIEKILEVDLFREFTMPSELSGLRSDSELGIEVRSKFEENKDDFNYRYSDEETAFEFFTRIKSAIKYLEDLNCENVAVISHGFFIRNFITRLLLPEEQDFNKLEELADKFRTNNTGMTKLSFDAGRKEKWRIHTFNDHSHLADYHINLGG